MSGYNEEQLSGGESTWTCLQKPFSQQTLTQTVRAILDATGEGGRRRPGGAADFGQDATARIRGAGAAP
jgi:hypothetical protein